MSAACPDGRCDGSGFLYDEEKRTARPCSCRPQRLARKRAAAVAGRLPTLYRGVSFDREPVLSMRRGPQENVVRAVRHYCSNIDAELDDGKGVWFVGDIGTGKTTLAMLISKTAMAADRTVAIYSLPRLLAMLRDTFRDGSEMSLTGLIDRLCSVDLLHIDDVGAEQPSPWVLEQLYSIVNTRYEDQKSIVVTTNLVTKGPVKVFDSETGAPRMDPDTGQQLERHPDFALRAQIGDRTVSRLYEMCGTPLPLYGEDLRSYVQFDGPVAAEVRTPATAGTGRWLSDSDRAWEEADPDEPPAYGRRRAI
jgi:DNA replication protein DnaC